LRGRAAEAQRSALAVELRHGFNPNSSRSETDMRFQRGKSHPSKRKSPVSLELASTKVVDKFASIAPDFFEKILDMDLNDCLITDESSLWDFHTEKSNDLLYSKILEAYGVDVSDVEKGNLAKIFRRIMEVKQP